MPSVEGHAVTMLTLSTRKGLRMEGNFDLLWQKILKLKEEADVSESQLPRPRKMPHRYEQGMAVNE